MARAAWMRSLASGLLGRRRPGLAQPGVAQSHLQEAIGWLYYASRQSGDGGIPAGYDLLRDRWLPSYPETTGYTVPTLLACSNVLGRPELQEVAIELAEYLLSVQCAEGGVAHWKQDGAGRGEAIVFDTGQVIFGWLAAWEETGEPSFLAAAEKAGEWLLGIQDPSGAWIRHQHLNVVKVIDTRVAWALLQLAQATGRQVYADGAQRNLDWALTQQQPNGWFQRASFLPAQDPFTHTIAYTAEGLLECGIVLGEERYIEAARQVADVMLRLQRPDGSLASSYNERWAPTARSSCLTGDCQMAISWLRFHDLSGEHSYLDGARRALAFVAGTQNLRTRNPNVRGAIAGSFPIYGRYARFRYPNWAAKFFIDALLALEAAEPQL